MPGNRPRRKISTRRISFEESLRDTPRHFAQDGDLIASHIIAALSSVFPEGEDFFVRSVRHYRDQISDPVLAREVAAFIGQEAIHGREHRALNHRLDTLGYPAKRIERMVRWGLTSRERLLTPAFNLATTAALEHYTATLAEILLRDDHARDLLGTPEVTDVFLWHALEESEHKAVAFDVYRAVGGTERTRVRAMNLMTITFSGGMTIEIIVSLLGDRATYQRGRLRRSLARLRDNPFLRRDVWLRLRDYNRPDFHPDDNDTDDLLEQWRTELFGPDGRLNALLASADSAKRLPA